MPEPTTNPLPTPPARRLVPWIIFSVVLLAALVSFFVYADRVPSLLQALADR
jgi:hypothetical protein